MRSDIDGHGLVIYDGTELPIANSQVRRHENPLPDVHLLASDPGETCGFAEFIRRAGHTRVTLWEVPANLDVNPTELWSFLQARQLPAQFLVEQFTVAPGKIAVNTTALEVIGILKLWASYHKLRVFRPQPSLIQGKAALVNEDFQRILNLWGVGLVHANDALRHIISHLIVEWRENDWLRVMLQASRSPSA